MRLYPLMKFATEKLCRIFYFEFALPVTVLRPTYVFHHESVYNVPWIDWIIKKAKNNEKIEVTESEGFASVYVDELIDAFMFATLNNKAIGQVFNVVNPNTFVTYYEVAQHHVAENNSNSQIVVVKPSELVESVPTSSEKIQKVLGWKPWTTKEDALNPQRLRHHEPTLP